MFNFNSAFRNTLIILLLVLFSKSFSQIPIEGSTLHYTQVYFEEKFCKAAVQYKLELFEDSSAAPIDHIKASPIPAFNVNNLKWNTKYQWRVKALNQKAEVIWESTLHYFRIGKIMYSLNEDNAKLEIHANDSTKHAGGLVMLDYARGIFTRNGERLWTTPIIPKLVNEKRQVRDFKLSCDNTITLIAGNIPIEIDFEANVLWTAPHPFIFKGDSITYHHDFRKLSNGNYMVLAHKKVARRVINDAKRDSLQADFNLFVRNDTLFKRTFQTMLFEFDKNGKVIWYWDSNKYITDEDLNYKKTASSLPSFGTHANAFSVSKDNSKIYVGFRDLNRIVRIDRKTKKVEFSYGEKYPSGDGQVGEGLIVGQHDATITDRGTILILNNNNDIKKGSEVSNLLELKDVSNPKEDLVVWSFSLKFDTLTDGKTSAAGNVLEMKNSNLLVCAGVMPRLFEVTKSKEIVWDAFVFNKNIGQDTWVSFPQYRIGYTPQLYFYHFIAKNNAIESGKNSISIYNTGNTADSYTVKLTSENKSVKFEKKTSTINKGEMIEVPVPAVYLNAKNISITIISNHNRNISKSIVTTTSEAK